MIWFPVGDLFKGSFLILIRVSKKQRCKILSNKNLGYRVLEPQRALHSRYLGG